MSANRLTRREFCSTFAAAAAATSLASTSDAQVADVCCYLAHSGPPRSGLTIGAIMLRNVLDRGKEVHSIRGQASYLRSVRSKSTDRRKTSFCEILFDHLVSQPDITFVGTNISFRSWPDNAEEREVLYLGMYRRVLASMRLPRGAHVSLYTKDHGIIPVKRFKEQLKQLNPWFPTVTDRPSNVHKEFRDIAGLFAGVVRSAGSTKNNANIAIASHMLAKLQVAHLDEANLASHPKFRVQNIVV